MYHLLIFVYSYEAAKRSGLNFKLFISLDMTLVFLVFLGYLVLIRRPDRCRAALRMTQVACASLLNHTSITQINFNMILVPSSPALLVKHARLVG